MDIALKNNKSLPLVSICIPTHNGAQFIVAALNSCKSQDYPNLELVISDDESLDATIELIDLYSSDFPFPVKIISHNPSGIGANWNNCLRHSRGKYIKFLFQDDLLEPTCISAQVNLIESMPNVALAGCKRKILIEKSSVENKEWLLSYQDLQKSLKLSENGVYVLTRSDFNFSFFYEGPLNKIGEPSTVLLNRECLNSVGHFREDLNQVLDLEYWWRLMDKYTILISPQYLATFRLHDNQATNKNRSSYLHDYLAIKSLILTKYLWKMPIMESRKVLVKEIAWASKTLMGQVFGIKR